MKQVKYDNKEFQRVLFSQQSIGLTGVANARELGGYISSDGRRIKRGRLIRSGQLGCATADDNRILQEKYHTGLIIDLRTPRETVAVHEQAYSGTKYVNLSVLDDTEIGETELYLRIMFGATAKAAYKQFFRLLLEHEGERAILFHGVHGNDRTGVAAALLLTALDIPEKTVIDDYLLSNSTNAHTVQVNDEQVKVAAYADGIRLSDKVYAHSLNYIFSVACLEYGSVVEYIKETCGLSEFDIKELKNKYLV